MGLGLPLEKDVAFGDEKRRWNAELDMEFQAHLAMLAEENISVGSRPYQGFEFESIKVLIDTPEAAFGEYEFTAVSSKNGTIGSSVLVWPSGRRGTSENTFGQ